MSEIVNVIDQEQIDATVKRIEDFEKSKSELDSKLGEIDVHLADLEAIEKTYGADSKEYSAKKVVLDVANEAVVSLEAKVGELSFKRSELKPVLDEVTKRFEKSLHDEQEKEYVIEFGECEKDEEGNLVTPCLGARKNYKQVMDYLNKDVEWTPTSVPGLMMLVSNMEDNLPWVRAGQFDGTIKLRSANILVLWNSLIKNLTGKGYYEAKTFITLWTNIGKALSDAVNKVNVGHSDTREISDVLNKIQDAYDYAVDDLVGEQEVTTKDEVDPEV